MTMPSKARRLGAAFALGAAYATGITAAMDEAKWIRYIPTAPGQMRKAIRLKGARS